MQVSPAFVAASSPLLREAASEPPEAGLQAALARAWSAAHRACRRMPHDRPERAQWLQCSGGLLDGLLRAAAGGSPGLREALCVHLDDVVETSRDELELLRRLTLLGRHAADHVRLYEDRRVPSAVRRRGRALQFRLCDRVARVHRDPELERLARRRNEIFTALGLRPRSITLLDWCEVAVRIAQGGAFREALAGLSAPEAERLLAAKLRFDLLAVELNIALDDLVDDGRNAALFALTVQRVLGSGYFREDTAVGRYFLEQLERAAAQLEGTQPSASTRYLALVDELHHEVVSAGRDLAGGRWDEVVWVEQMRRIVGAMMLSLVRNLRPDLLAGVDWSRDFHGADRLSVLAANGNRVVFELMGLWCHERVTGRCFEGEARRRLLAVFEDLQIAQQLGNCLATLERELDEGDRSNCIVERAAEAWRGMSLVQRATLVREACIGPHLGALSLTIATDELVEALYDVLERHDADGERALAISCLRALVDRSGTTDDVLEHWQRRVDAAAEGLDSLGLCGTSSTQAQVDLLLLHLLLLKKSALAVAGERH